MRSCCKTFKISRIFYPLKWLKRFNLSKKKSFFVYQRSINISPEYIRTFHVFTSRGLYPVRYYGGALLRPNVYKYGMFAFTRKPFAIPEKKVRGRKR